ncbi:uncharacterized protein [Penaeus vannamei]|uniref:uncharacterized protein n=1 Tax=Penaeus vannamei TaxID=6689 RepID=UPI00387FAEB8
MYQVDPPASGLDASDVAIPLPIPPISEDPPTLTEVREAISKLKDGKAASIYDIPAELPKAGGEYMVWGLHTVLAPIWQSGPIPPDLLRGVVIPFWKWKGDCRDCGNCCGITLLSILDRNITQVTGLISSLHTGIKSSAKCGGGLSTFFPGNSGENLFTRIRLATRTLKSQRALHTMVVLSMSQGCHTRKSVARLVWQQEP